MMAKDNEGYYAVSAFLAVIITLIIHYFFIAPFELHTTIHVAIGIFIFFILSALFSAILGRLW